MEASANRTSLSLSVLVGHWLCRALIYCYCRSSANRAGANIHTHARGIKWKCAAYASRCYTYFTERARKLVHPRSSRSRFLCCRVFFFFFLSRAPRATSYRSANYICTRGSHLERSWRHIGIAKTRVRIYMQGKIASEICPSSWWSFWLGWRVSCWLWCSQEWQSRFYSRLISQTVRA